MVGRLRVAAVLGRVLGLAGALLLAAPAGAVEVLTGTLKKAAESGEVVIGHRTASVPFSYLEKVGAGDHPVGYAIDLCQEIVDDIGKAVGRPLRIRYAPVTSQDRFEALNLGRIDLECGSTTTNAERRKVVAFSPIDFISATKLLVRRESGIGSYRDLGGKRVVVTAGTTNEAAVRDMLAKARIEAQVLTGKDHAESYAMVKDGRAEAFALDDVLLYGLKAADGAAGSGLTVLPDKLSFEPYAIGLRKDDPELASLVTGTFQRLAETRELRWLYDKWFLKRLPNGARLDIPMSDDLRTSFLVMGLQDY